MKHIPASELFTDQDVAGAAKLISETKSATDLHARIVNEIIFPIMPRINKVTRQLNDEDYMGYALEHVARTIMSQRSIQ